MLRSRVATISMLLGLQLTACPDPSFAQPVQPAQPTVPAAPAVTLTGVYEVDPVPQVKRFQGTWLRIDGSSESFVLSYRPEPRYFALIGKRVVATGRHRTLSGSEQAINARHFDADSLVLAPGEAPPATGSPTIPAPPLAPTREALTALRGRWARVFGRAETLTQSPHERRMITRLIVAMPDGHRLEIQDFYLDNLQWDRAKKTDTITLIGRATDGGAKGPSIGVAAICQGHVERCGMLP